MICSMTAALGRKRATLGTKDKGFTLIELLVVVLILGVLSAVAIPIFLNQQDGAKDSAVAAQITNAKVALVAEATSTGAYPASETEFLARDGYAISDKISVAYELNATDDTFIITGTWTETDDHTHVITESTNSIKS